MNERIKQLAVEAGMTDDKFGMYFAKDKHDEDGVDLAKFAELIVKECIAQCQSQNTIITTATGTTHWGEISDAVNQIKQHFGVEE